MSEIMRKTNEEPVSGVILVQGREGKNSPAGLWLIYVAMLMSIEGIHDYEMRGAMPVAEEVSSLNYRRMEEFFVMLGEDKKKVLAVDLDDDAAGARIQQAVTGFQLDNTASQQLNSFLTAIVNQVNTFTSNTTQTISLHYNFINSVFRPFASI